MKTFSIGLERGAVIALLILPPIFWGSVHPLPSFLIILLSVILFVSFTFSERGDEWGPGVVQKDKRYLLILPFIFSGVVIFQIIPLPVFVHRLISPGTHFIIERYIEPLPSFFPVSISPLMTLNSLLFLISSLFIFLYASLFIKRRRWFKAFVTVIIGIGSFEALYGILVYITGNRYVLTQPKVHFIDSMTGTFINRNHFAGHLEMTIGMTAGMILYQLYRVSKNKGGWKRGRFYHVLREKGGLFLTLFALFALQVTALLYSKSRMGITSLFFSILIVSILLVVKGRKRVFMAYIPLLLLLPLVFLFGIDPLLERFSSSPEAADLSEGRFGIWLAALRIFTRFPFLGSGLGTFERVITYYKPPDIYQRFDHAHNDLLELLSDTGIMGMIPVVLMSALYLRYLGRRWFKRNDPLAVCFTAGAAISLLSLLFHSITDFNLHIPSNGVLFAFLSGFALSVVDYGKRSPREGNLP